MASMLMFEVWLLLVNSLESFELVEEAFFSILLGTSGWTWLVVWRRIVEIWGRSACTYAGGMLWMLLSTFRSYEF